jgi:Uncharacterized conserved protein
MSVMEISFSPFDKGIRDNGNFITSCILLSKQKGVKCRLQTTKVIIEGDKEILFDILHELEHISFNMGVKNIKISLNIDGSRDRPPTEDEPLSEAEIDYLSGDMQNSKPIERRG